MATVITSTDSYPILVPVPKSIPGAYIPSLMFINGVTVKKVYASPDYARDVYPSIAIVEAIIQEKEEEEDTELYCCPECIDYDNY